MHCHIDIYNNLYIDNLYRLTVVPSPFCSRDKTFPEKKPFNFDNYCFHAMPLTVISIEICSRYSRYFTIVLRALT